MNSLLLMKQSSINNIRSIEPAAWDAFVAAHPRGNIFQTTDYLNCHTAEYGFETFGFAALEGDTIVGVVSGMIVSNYFWPVNKLTRRAIVEGGPLALDDDADVCGDLLEAVTVFTRKKAVYTQFRNMWDTEYMKSHFIALGYQYEPHLDFIHDLALPEEELRQGISKNKRANVRKTLNKGVVFCEAQEDELERCIELVEGTYQRIGLPCPKTGYFRWAVYRLGNKAKVFVAKSGETIIGTRMEMLYHGLVYDWYAGSDDDWKNYYPNDFLPYHILFWGKEHGFQTFDFGGAGKPDVPYGVRDHKAKFGGQLVEYGRYERVNARFVYTIASKLIAWKKQWAKRKG